VGAPSKDLSPHPAHCISPFITVYFKPLSEVSCLLCEQLNKPPIIGGTPSRDTRRFSEQKKCPEISTSDKKSGIRCKYKLDISTLPSIYFFIMLYLFNCRLQ
jgi:hypothetical protein